MNGQLVTTWQLFFEIQDGGERYLQFLKLCISVVFDMIQIKVPMFPQILVKIDQIVQKWQQFFEIQDGGGRHLKFWLGRFFDVTDVF